MDRFDLEQQILECWKVTGDIRAALEHGSESDLRQNLEAVARVADIHFEKLWAIFEHMCHDQQFTNTRASAAPDTGDITQQSER